MKPKTSRILLWTVFLFISATCALISYIYFPASFPIVHLNLTMNRTEAVAAAQQLATDYKLGPQEPHIATSFATDEKTKTFIELDAGGKEALIAVMDAHLYEPYLWQVRLFKPFEQREATITFMPDGTPYGFKERLSENEMLANLSVAEAQQSAETFIQNAPWHILLSHYTLVETSQDTTPSGRIDHTFVYERTDTKIGEGTYRLSVVVSGNHISELNHFIKIPQRFILRYQEMRSHNAMIAYLGTLLMILLYGIGGCIIGFFYLLHKRALSFKPAFYWAIGIAFGVALTILNKLPLYWMNYNTSFAPINFLLQMGLIAIITFLGMALLFFSIFMTAEGLTRLAFPDKIQFWHLFNPTVARSYSVLGYTISGYLLVPICLAYVITFYLFTTRWFGWWLPSSALFNPDMLATYFPWLESIALSLQAGFLEECLFRAIPLASAILLGKRFGKRNWWVIGAFIVQAIIFGAAHANYPAQPAYARLIELFVFSFVLGGVYLRFGLLPSIISHFGYDVFLFALPLLVSTADGARLNQCIIALLSLMPLWIILWARLKQGSWHTVPQNFLNASWQPPHSSPSSISVPPTSSVTLARWFTPLLLVVGLISTGIWIITTPFTSDAPCITLTRQGIQNQATERMHKVPPSSSEWTTMISALTSFKTHPFLKQHRFIWQKEKEWYPRLIGSYLTPPHWVARSAHFTGSLDERAEEYIFSFNPDGSLWRRTHKLPETASGPTLSQQEALSRAQQYIQTHYQLAPDNLQEVSARSEKQPNRLDWVIEYKDLSTELLHGEARISVSFAGAEIVDAYRFIHVPEEWERTEENKLLFTSILTLVCKLLLVFFIVVSTFFVWRKWQSFYIPFSPLLFFGLLILLFGKVFNLYPSTIITFSTSQPYIYQLLIAFGFSFITLPLTAAILTIFICFVSRTPQPFTLKHEKPLLLILLGFSMGAFCSALLSFLSWIIPSIEPTWANYHPLLYFNPLLAVLFNSLIRYINLTLLLLFGCISCQSIPFLQKHNWTIIFIWLLSGFNAAETIYNADNLILFITAGTLLGITFSFFYHYLFRYNYTVLPIAVAAYFFFEQLKQMIFNCFPHAFLMYMGAIALLFIVAWVWYSTLGDNAENQSVGKELMQ